MSIGLVAVAWRIQRHRNELLIENERLRAEVATLRACCADLDDIRRKYEALRDQIAVDAL